MKQETKEQHQIRSYGKEDWINVHDDDYNTSPPDHRRTLLSI